MRGTELGREFAYTATNGTTLVAFLTFFLLLKLAFAAGLIGLWLLVATVPALIRYLMLLLDARARGRDSKPPGIELFSWFGTAWSLVPVIHIFVIVYTANFLERVLPVDFVYVFVLLATLLLPASLAVLAVTRTPTESVRPGAIASLVRRCGVTYAVAPGYIIVCALAVFLLHRLAIPEFIVDLATLYAMFAGFAVTGALIRPLDLYNEVSLPVTPQPDDDVDTATLERERTAMLSHAYGFISRGNREAGLRHIRAWLDSDPEPGSAWPWIVDRMLAWESPQAGLLVAQRYLGRLLRDGDAVNAVKLMLRCRLLDDGFLPLSEDRELAHAAALRCQHDELVALLE